VIDVIRDSLLLFGETLSVLGDDFALYGFSSLRRQQVRMQELKSFIQRYDDRGGAGGAASGVDAVLYHD
jgi:nitric oxide reductase NorD protein